MSLRLLASSSVIAIGFACLPAHAQETITYQYDALGRLISSQVSGGPNNNVTTTTSFDSAGNRTNYKVTGSTGSTPTPTPTPTPSGPVANADSYTITANQACSAYDLDVLANDQDPGGHYPLTITSVTSSDPFFYNWWSSGMSYTGYGTVNGGVKTATYVIQNSIGQTATGQVTVTVQGSLFCD
jgi:hypothetical protein